MGGQFANTRRIYHERSQGHLHPVRGHEGWGNPTLQGGRVPQGGRVAGRRRRDAPTRAEGHRRGGFQLPRRVRRPGLVGGALAVLLGHRPTLPRRSTRRSVFLLERHPRVAPGLVHHRLHIGIGGVSRGLPR